MTPEPHKLQSELRSRLADGRATDAAVKATGSSFEPGARPIDVATAAPDTRRSLRSGARLLAISAALLAVSAATIVFEAFWIVALAGAGLGAFALVKAVQFGRRGKRSPENTGFGTDDVLTTAEPTPDDTPPGAEENALDTAWHANSTAASVAAMFDALGDIFVTLDETGRITVTNRTFTEATGVTAPMGLTLTEAGLVPRETEAGIEVTTGSGAGKRHWAWRQTMSREPRSGLLVTHAIGRDVTAERHARAMTVEARAKAEAASTAKTRFLATVSHEIRTPLNGILGMTHLLSQTEVTPEQASYLKTVRESGHSLLSLIEDLLDTTSIEAGRFHLRQGPCDPRQLVESSCELMAAAAHEKGIEIASHVAPDVPETIESDDGRLKQILFNLIGNAVKFTWRGGILVELEKRDNLLVFHVSDSGPGLRPEDQTRIFEEFERADDSSTRRHGGAGLGLSISSRIVAALGGRLFVTSTLGKGSRFTFTLPLATNSAALRPAQQFARAPLAGKAALIFAPEGPVSRCLVRSIREHGGRAIDAHDQAGIETALAELGVISISDLLIDRRLALASPRLVEEIAGRLRSASRTVLIAPEDSRDLELSPELAAGKWLVRPVRATSLVDVLTLRDDRSERDRATAPIAAPALLRPSDAPTFDILLAEDNPVNAMVVRTMLAREGHRVTLVGDGLQLVDAALDRPDGKCRFDLAITDISMPELDGTDAIRQIREAEAAEQLRRLPIIVLSADGQAATRDAALAAGADGHAEKPIDPEWLSSLVGMTAARGRKLRG